MLDPSKVSLKFKPSKSGKAVIAYCEEYPEIQGNGANEEQATSSFWKQFNAKELEIEHEESERKKEEQKKAS